MNRDVINNFDTLNRFYCLKKLSFAVIIDDILVMAYRGRADNPLLARSLLRNKNPLNISQLNVKLHPLCWADELSRKAKSSRMLSIMLFHIEWVPSRRHVILTTLVDNGCIEKTGLIWREKKWTQNLHHMTLLCQCRYFVYTIFTSVSSSLKNVGLNPEPVRRV